MSYDLKKYKFAKQVCKDIPFILKIVDLTIKGLSKFKHYKPVERIVTVIIREKHILEGHLDTYQKVLKNKGKTE